MSNVEGMDALMKRLHAIGETQPVMRVLQLSTIAEAKALAPRATGHLARSIVPGNLDKDSAVVEVRVPYAAAQEYGSKPHIIKPVRAKVLAWGGARRLSGNLRVGATATHFATLVHHPGNKAHPYLIPGAQNALRKSGVLAAIVAKWNRAA